MSEILEFPHEKRLTAEGRFFITCLRQEQETEQAKNVGKIALQPSERRIALARKELNFIFSPEVEIEADAIYQKGLHDVVCGSRKTPEAVFFAHVQHLTDIANRAFDKPRSE